MRLYELELESEVVTFRTLEEARKRGRTHRGARYKIDRIETVPLTKEVVVNMINGWGGYVAERETIFDNLS